MSGDPRALDVLVMRGIPAAGGAKQGEAGGVAKAWWTRVGRAFPDKSGEGWTVVLDALPLAEPGGQAKLYLKPPRERTGGEPR